MSRSLTASTLYNELQDRLELRWLVGSGKGKDRSISDQDLTARPAFAGYLNLIHPNKIQVIGNEELNYLENLDPERLTETLENLFGDDLLALVVGDNLETPQTLIETASNNDVPILCSALPSWELVSLIQYHVANFLSPSATLHGVFMEVFTIGVLITGDAGSGKSELALELLNRGHRLIADDAPEFTRISPEIINGTCPEALQDCLEVRGLGVLNIRRMFGDTAVKMNKYLRLIVNLRIPEPGEKDINDRLHGDSSEISVLGLNVPCITLPVLAGRNLAVIVEAAVRDFMLKMKGFDAAEAFVERHARILHRTEKSWGN